MSLFVIRHCEELVLQKHRNIMSSWNFSNRQTGRSLEGTFESRWEVSLDPISDDYTPNEISAIDLLGQWVKQVKAKYPDNLIPIYWFVLVKGSGINTFENMPAQYNHFSDVNKDFLTFFTEPTNSTSGQKINWLNIPVNDKFWNSNRADKGGFIQEATGWKPSALQPYVYLPALINMI